MSHESLATIRNTEILDLNTAVERFSGSPDATFETYEYFKGTAEHRADVRTASITSAQKAAFASVVRVRRGMPTDVPGATYTKDLTYHNGSTKVWQYLEKRLRSADESRELLTGKYDITRPDQCALSNQAALTIEAA